MGENGKWSYVRGLWRRLFDRAKAPCIWWRPRTLRVTFASEDEWQRHHDEVSGTVRRVMLAIIVFSLFCIIALGAPDISLLSTDATIKIPFADTPVSYMGFIIIGPLVLICMMIYLHIFVGCLCNLDAPIGRTALPFVFNMRAFFPRMLSEFLLYWLVPFVLFIFAWKVLPRPESKLFIIFAAFVALGMAWLRIRRFDWRKPFTVRQRSHYAALWGAAIFLVSGIAMQVWSKDVIFHRPVSLNNADLRGQNLKKVNLEGADISRADLRGAFLVGANLSGASLLNANLSTADLTFANLSAANLAGANLSGADMSFVRLHEADLWGTNLRGVSWLGCHSLTTAKNWQMSLRDATLSCEAGIPY